MYIVIQQKLSFCTLISSHDLDSAAGKAAATKLIKVCMDNAIPVITHFSDTKVKNDVIAKVM